MFNLTQTAVEESPERQAPIAPSGEGIECACGCGMRFEARRKGHRYFGQPCRERAMKRKSVPMRVPISEVGKIKAKIVHQNARESVVQQIPATEGRGLAVQRQAIHLAALWLINRLLEEQQK